MRIIFRGRTKGVAQHVPLLLMSLVRRIRYMNGRITKATYKVTCNRVFEHLSIRGVLIPSKIDLQELGVMIPILMRLTI